VKSLTMEEDKLTVIRKDGSKEVYDFTSEKEKKAFYQKYGRYFVPPPPPPPPGHGVSIAPGTLMDESNTYPAVPGTDITVAAVADRYAPVEVTGHVKTVTSVIAPVTTEVNVHGVTAATLQTPVVREVKVEGLAATAVTGPAKVIVPVKEVVVTGNSLTRAVANVPVAVNIPRAASVDGLTEVAVAGHPLNRAGINGEKVLELKIYKSTTRERIDQLIAEADAKGVELKFDKIEYDGNGKLTRLAGKIEKEGSKTTFSISDFEVLILSVTRKDGKYDCSVGMSKEKDVQ
jgi:hypothetical protein